MIMTINPVQKEQLQSWLQQNLSLSDIQKRIQAEWKLSMTYMDLRFLLDDLALEIPQPKASEPKSQNLEDAILPQSTSSVKVDVDKVMRPGALISGSVTFSDGHHASWQLDQMGRIGVIPGSEGYKPSPADLKEFQTELQHHLQRSGF